jgi:hypothetical protein
MGPEINVIETRSKLQGAATTSSEALIADEHSVGSGSVALSDPLVRLMSAQEHALLVAFGATWSARGLAVRTATTAHGDIIGYIRQASSPMLLSSVDLEDADPFGLDLLTLSRTIGVSQAPAFTTAELEAEFKDLAEDWLSETSAMSSIDAIVLHEAYQQIIGMGPPALPLILAELEREPAYWFWALAAIARDDPSREANDFDEARELWLEWGRDRGLLRVG